MSIEANKAVVRRFWEEGWNGQNPARFDELMDARYAAVEKPWAAEVWAAYPDSRFAVEELIAEGDKVVSRFTWSGTQRGEFWGVPPTGKRMTVAGIWIHRVVDGRITWEGRFGQVDWLGWRRQIGLLPVEEA